MLQVMLSFFLCSPPCVEITSHSWCYPGLAISSWQTSFCFSCLLIHNSKERKDAFSILLRLLVFSCWSMSGPRDALGMLLPHKLVLCFLHPWVSGSWPLAVLSLAPHFTELLDAAEESLDFSFFRLPHPFYGFTPQKYTISVFCLIEEYSQWDC